MMKISDVCLRSLTCIWKRKGLGVAASLDGFGPLEINDPVGAWLTRMDGLTELYLWQRAMVINDP